jgi:hypothetical protein
LAGQLQHQVVSPNRKVKKRLGKTYVIKAWRAFKGDEPEVFKAGTLMLNGEKKPCKPADLKILDPINDIAKVTLYEGKYHQIRRMFSGMNTHARTHARTRAPLLTTFALRTTAIGNGVPRSITRVSIGPLQLGDLPAGKWRHLTDDELRELRAMVDTGTPAQEKKAKTPTAEAGAEEDEEDEGEEEEEDKEGEDDEDYEEDQALAKQWEMEWKAAARFAEGKEKDVR